MTALNKERFELALAQRRAGVRRPPGVVARGNPNVNAIKSLQQQLTRLGFPVQVDGVFGPETERAVKQFQRQAGVAVDGKVGTQTMQAMQTAIPPAPNPADPSISAIQPGPRGVGAAGTQGTAGMGLRSVGGAGGPGTATRGRRAATTPPPGTPGTSSTAKSGPIGSTQVQGPTGYTWDKGASGTDYTGQTPNQLPPGVPGAPGSPQGPVNNNPAFNTAHPRGTGGQFAVKSGDQGAMVQNTQLALNQAAGSKLRTDGQFGKKTEAAVRTFQQRNGLKVDGIVGVQTSSALRRRLDRKAQPFATAAAGLPY